MSPTDEHRTYPARERWFWTGVGFVSALVILLLGLLFATFLMARATPRPLVRQAAAPPTSRSAPPPAALPPSPSVSASPPRGPGAARPDGSAPAAGPVPKVPAGAARKPPSPVRIVERAGPPREAARAPKPPASPSAAAPKSSPRPVPARSQPAPGRPPASEQVGASRQEWGDRPPPDRVAAASRGDGEQPSSDAEDTRSGSSRVATPPELITGRDAEYPLGAMADGVTGTVKLKIIVDPEGFVERAIVIRSSGDRRLDAAAIRAALAWRYQPAHRGRRAVTGDDTATFEFYHEGRGRD